MLEVSALQIRDLHLQGIADSVQQAQLAVAVEGARADVVEAEEVAVEVSPMPKMLLD